MARARSSASAAAVGVAILRVFPQAGEDDGFEVDSDLRAVVPRRGGWVGNNVAHELDDVRGLEERAAGEQLVERCAKGIDVRATVNPLARDLLGRHEGQGADRGSRFRQACVRFAVERDPKVGEPRLARAIDEDVRRLDVTVHNAQLVAGVEPFGDRLAPTQAVLNAELPGCQALAE